MTIRRDRVGLWMIACDRCANTAQYALAVGYFETYTEAKMDGWLARLVDGDWIHVCPTCLPAFYPDKPPPLPVPRDLTPVTITQAMTCPFCMAARQCQLGRYLYYCTGTVEPRYHVYWHCPVCLRRPAGPVGRDRVAGFGIVREQLPVLSRSTWMPDDGAARHEHA